MSLRFSPEQAAELGIISKSEAQKIKKKGAERSASFLERIQNASRSKPKPRTRAAQQLHDVTDPQTILYNALVERLPAGAVQWEVPNLIEGRKFRVDILVGDRWVVEMDGFVYHRSKDAFQSDRERQNLFAAKGYFVFRTYYKEVLDPEKRAELVELIAGTYEKNQC